MAYRDLGHLFFDRILAKAIDLRTPEDNNGLEPILDLYFGR